jgi:hypothetical protein
MAAAAERVRAVRAKLVAIWSSPDTHYESVRRAVEHVDF